MRISRQRKAIIVISANQSLQLTAGAVVLSMFLGLRQVLVCRTFSGKLPPRLNLGRWAANGGW
ncbi:MAG: hypothetical protein ACE5PV_21185 [Candidatus Poribacteria bacterium]